MFGDQIERALEFVPIEQFKIIVYDDFVNFTRQVYENVLSFLNLPLDERTDFPIIHETRYYRSLRIARNLMYPPLPVKGLFKVLRLMCLERGVKRMIMSWNEAPGYRQELSPEFREELVEVFHSDVEKLERILNRDLSHWLYQ